MQVSEASNWQEHTFTTLIPEARQRLVELGAPLLQIEAESRLALAEQKIKAFEQKYNTTLSKLQREGLPEGAGIELHEDFVEWSGWQRTREEASQIIASLQPLREPSLASTIAG
jgi:hypothetical protein